MNAAQRIERIAPLIVSTSSNAPLRVTERPQRGNAQDYICLRRGSYVETTAWSALSEEDQHLARAIATNKGTRRPPVFSHITAAIIHGIPVYGLIPDATHITGPAAGGSTGSAQVIRHRADADPSEIIEIAGMYCTSITRTLHDLARFAPPETALAAIDWYLHHEFSVNRLIDWARVSEWRAEMTAQLVLQRGARGARRAQQILALADPRKESVLESISHLQLHRLGIDVELQVPVPSPKGNFYYVDFEFKGRQMFGECDGKEKYVKAATRAGLSAEEILYREKRRQDWICGTTRKGLIRWGFADVRTPQLLARRLRAFGIALPA